MYRTIIFLAIFLIGLVHSQELVDQAIDYETHFAFPLASKYALVLKSRIGQDVLNFPDLPHAEIFFKDPQAGATNVVRDFSTGTIVFDVFHKYYSTGFMLEIINKNENPVQHAFGVFAGDDGTSLCVRSQYGNEITVGCSERQIRPKKWTRIALVFTDELTIYINGRQIKLDRPVEWQPFAQALFLIGTPSRVVPDHSHDLNCFINRIAMFSAPLTSNQIKDISTYNAYPRDTLLDAFGFDITLAESNAVQSQVSGSSIKFVACKANVAPLPAEGLKKRDLAAEQDVKSNWHCNVWGDPHIKGYNGVRMDYGGKTGNYPYHVWIKFLLAACPPSGIEMYSISKRTGHADPVMAGMEVRRQGQSFEFNCQTQRVLVNKIEVGFGTYWIAGIQCTATSGHAHCSSGDFEFLKECSGQAYIKWQGGCIEASKGIGACAGHHNPICDYGAWSTCTKKCQDLSGSGTHTKSRTSGTPDCGPATVTESCNTQYCPCEWTEWSDCPVTCNTGSVFRHRKASSGPQCDVKQVKKCVMPPCPCKWGDWTECNKVCGGGSQRKNLLPGSGYNCVPDINMPWETKVCNTHECDCPIVSEESCTPGCGPQSTKKIYYETSETTDCPEFREIPCEIPCNVNECLEETHNCHKDLAICRDVACETPDCFGLPSYECVCKEGYKGDGRKCEDIDECASDVSPCHKNAKCVNLPGSYVCECKPDYVGDGVEKCEPLCDHSEWTACEGFCDGVGKKSRGVRPTLIDEPACLPLVETCEMEPCAPPVEEECVLPDAQQAICESLCGCALERGEVVYKTCLLDCCWSNDPASTIEYCQTTLDLCINDNALLLAEDPDAEVKDCPVPCPLNCMDHGKCQTGTCICDEGWTGKGCQLKSRLVCMKTSWLGFTQDIAAFQQLEDVNVDTMDALVEAFDQRSLSVGDSLLVYAVQYPTDHFAGTTSTHLFIINDDVNSDVDGGSYELTITASDGADLSTIVAHAGNGVKFAATSGPSWTKISAKWESGVKSGFFLTNLPDTVLDFQIQAVNGFSQVLVGSGTGIKFDVIKVPQIGEGAYPPFSIHLRNCDDQCSLHTDCTTCSSDPLCGWCKESNQCLFGNAAGPIRAECKAWRYTFEENVARRLNVKYGWPVSYEEVDVLLPESAEDDLPVKLAIDVGNYATSVWESIFALPTGKPEFTALIREKFPEYLASFHDLPKARLGFVSYDAQKVELSLGLKSVHRTLSEFTDILTPIAKSQSSDAYYPIIETLTRIASSSLDYGFRAATRRAVFFFGDRPLDVDVEFTENFSAQKVKILRAHFYPIFVVTDSARSTYRLLVNKLGFGHVVEWSFFIPEKEIHSAASTVSLVVAEGNYINEASLKVDTFVSGLKEGYRARFSFPLHIQPNPKDTLLIAPGFGEATIENIESDRPFCVNKKINLREDSIDELVGERAYAIELLGSTFDEASVTFTITTLPTKGKLYQLGKDNTLGEQITVPLTKVLDPLNQVVLVVDEFEASIEGEIYTSVGFISNDQCIDSVECFVELVLDPLPNPPEVDSFEVVTTVDVPVEFSIADHKRDHDIIPPAPGSEQPTEWALKANPSNMITLLDGTPVEIGKYYSDPMLKVTPPASVFGEFEAVFVAKDTTDLVSTPGTIKIIILAISDGVRVIAPKFVIDKEDKWIPIKVIGRDFDSPKFWLTINLPSTFKGTFVVGPTAEAGFPVTDGQEFLYSGVPDKAKELSIQLWYKGEPNGYSCDENVVVECTVEQHSYTSFTVKGTDEGEIQTDPVVVHIILTNLNDAPKVVEDDLIVRTSEDMSIVETLSGLDADQTDKLVTIIGARPDNVDLFQVGGDKDGQLVGSDGILSNPEGKVRITPRENVHGDNEKDWFLTSFTYKVFDGKLHSAERTVNVHVVAVNDPSVPITTDASAQEDTPLIISLRATDSDTPLSDLIFKIAKLPQVGSLYNLDRNTLKKRQVAKLSAGLGTPVVVGQPLVQQSCEAGNDQVHGACIVFVPGKNFEGVDVFSWSVTDKDVFFPENAPNTVVTELSVSVSPVNDAPIATMRVPTVLENTFAVIKLGYTDAENDPVEYFVVQVPDKGEMYQYSDAVAGGDITSAQRIQPSPPVKVTDPDGRVVYRPPQDFNSENLPPTHFYEPKFTYYVHETTPKTLPAYQSNEFTSRIFIKDVNQAPKVWNDAENKAEEGLCYSSGKACEFPEDLGAVWPQSPNPQPIYVGGSDKEWNPSKVILMETTCGQDQVTFFTADNQEIPTPISNYALPGTVVTGPTPKLGAVLYFRPVQDASGFECSVTYKLNDGQLDSEDTKSVSFSIYPLNDAPRNELGNHIEVPESGSVTLIPHAVDPEGDKFTAAIVGCGQNNRGTLTLNGSPFVCPQNGEKVPLPGDSTDTAQWEIGFVPVPGESGDNYNSIDMEYDDGKENGKGFDTITFDVIAINNAPLIYIGDRPNEEFNEIPAEAVSHHKFLVDDGGVEVGKMLNLWKYIQIFDVDAGFAPVSLHFNLTHGKLTFGKFNLVPVISPENNNGELYYLFQGSIPELNELLNTLTWSSSGAVESGRVTMIVNDEGYTGACQSPDQPDADGVCRKNATVEVIVNSGYLAASLRAAAIATPAAAAAAVLAAAAGLTAFKKLSEEAANPGYQPWEADDDLESAGISSPIFETAAIDKENPLYVGDYALLDQ